jgi:hypothetical protein
MGSLNGSVHLAGTYYLNKGVIEPITLLGEVDANSVQVQWHQGLANRFVAMAGYRRYLETITPRVQAAPEAKTGSDYIHGSLRWLFPGDRPWTTSGIPELSLFGGFYIANEISDNFSEPNNGVMIGIAFKSALDLKKKKRKRRRPKGKYKGRSKSKKFKKDKYKRKKLYKKKR